ncbi:hypothetical protein NW759_006001 [Fusarium solani]|nr:hypothetical protein NW759_006001 [Fusarium solani]
MEAAASIAGLIALADLVFRYSAKYIKSAKGARKEAEDLSRETGNLALVLHRLSFVAIRLAETQSSDGTEVPSNITLHHLYDCEQLLIRLKKKLSAAESEVISTSRIEKIQGHLKWPFSSTETKENIRDLERHKQTINLALAADSLSCLSKVREDVKTVLDIQTNIILDKKRQEVLDFFTKANPYSEFDTNRRLRQGFTGLWLTKGSEFEEWYTTRGSKIWCSGIPGAGKSVLAAAIIDECLQRNATNPGTALAYFFCTYRNEITQEPTSILSSLCSQLARQDENAFEILKEYHDELTSERQLQAVASTKLIKILRRMCSSFDRVYLIVDGLDECAQQVEDCVESLAALLPSPQDETLNLALLSRDEIPIREIVGDQFQNIEIEAHTEDVDRYVAHELDQRIASRKLRLKDLALKDKIRKRLVDGAKGMFRWAACQLDYLCELRTDGARERALDNLPPTLFATYERILARINESSQDQQIVQRTLLLISSPYHGHLSLPQICEAISLQDDWEELLDQDVVPQEEVLRCCGSLVRTRRMSGRSGNLGIEFSHFSVQEYLQGECFKSPTLSAYGVSRQKACNLLASLCLQYLALKNHEQFPKEINGAEDEAITAMDQRDLQHPFYRHAATLWPLYASEGGKDCCLERIHDLFQLPKTPNFCVWATTLAAHSMSMYDEDLYETYNLWVKTPSLRKIDTIFIHSRLVRPNFTPLHMAAALGMPNICRHLLSHGAKVDVRSEFGTPLHFAIAGLALFDFETFDNDVCDSRHEVSPPFGRRQAGKALLEAGAKPSLNCISPYQKNYSSLSLVALFSAFDRDFEIAVDLIKADIAIGEEELAHFRERFEIFLELHYHSGILGEQGVVQFLEALGPPGDDTNSTPRSRLYKETYKWATKMKIVALNQQPAYQPMSGLSEDEAIECISLWIENDETPELMQLLKSSHSELVKSVRFKNKADKQGWTALHLAAYHRSMDVLNALLDFGLDANMADQAGTTPLHLCHFDYQLQALLQYGASTLVPDKEKRTVWHIAAMENRTEILTALVELDDRQYALQMVSSSNETPICAALNSGCKESVLLLSRYCNSKKFWINSKPFFQAAAELGSSEVVRSLLDLGVEVDGMDDTTGSPLHYLSTDVTIECIQLLKGFFPLDQRRRKDLRTPLESLLLRAVKKEVALGHTLLEAMLPNATASNPNVSSSLWSFVGLEVLKSAVDCWQYHRLDWLKDLVFACLKLGIMTKYEEQRKESALIPLVSAFAQVAVDLYKKAREQNTALWKMAYWESFSEIWRHIASETRYWDSAVVHPSMIRLLSISILNDDQEMISLLVKKGVDVHSRVDVLSPLDFACFPNVPVGERNFALLLEYATPEKVAQGNEVFGGCGPLHFCSGWDREGEGCAWKLKQMLGAGFDPNSPLSTTYGSPLAFHISRGSVYTAEILIEMRADPWARGSYPFDAPLEAVRFGRLSILEKMAAANGQTRCWDRTWVHVFDNRRFAGGNALHLAALHGNTKCLEFYLDQGLLSDLECHDDHLETPMHYAARFGRSSTIEFLKARGGSINAKGCDGLTPLHLAAYQGHLETAKTLINLGAEHQPCNRGGTPLMYAYAKGNESMIEALQSSSEEPQESSSSVKPPGTLRLLAKAMRNAILRSDVTACERIHALGCPINVEIYLGQAVTPLAVAICHQQDPEIVQWLIDSGATVSTVFPQPYQGRYLTALEAAVARPMFNSLLHNLLNKFLEEGGNFLDLARSPLYLAAECNNIEGLRILSGWLRNTYEGPEMNLIKSSRVVGRNVSQRETLPAFFNQRSGQFQRTPLHAAASRNNLDACAILIDGGANIEGTDFNNGTPLHIAASIGSIQVAKYLLDRGARPNPVDVLAQTPLMCAYQQNRWELVDLLTPYCQDVTSRTHNGESLLHFMTRFEPGSARREVSLQNFSRCVEQGGSLYSRDTGGVAPVHWILASHSPCYLKSLLDRDCQFLRPHEMAQWPHSCFRGGTHRLVAISKNLQLVRPSLSKHDLRQLCGVADSGNHSLLCRAAGWGLVEAIENLLALGVDMIEHECSDHGTPLTAAVSNRQIEVVKCLVRNGATIPYNLCHPTDSRVSMASPDNVIRQWLFVGRYMEQKRISNGTTDASGKIESWAGVCSVEVALKWEWKRLQEESTREYACRWQRILKDLRGKVVKRVGETDSKNGGSEDE